MVRVSLGLIVAVLLMTALPVHARDFKVYGYKTPSQGEVELVYWWDYFVKSDKDYD